MFKMAFKLGMCLCLYSSTTNGKKVENLEMKDPKIQKIIKNAYFEAVNKIFVRYQNAANKSQTAIKFLEVIIPNLKSDNNYEYFKKTLGDAVSPKITSISNGIKMTFGQQYNMSLTLNKSTGEILADGKTIQYQNLDELKKQLENQNKKSAILDAIIPTAEAAVIVPLVWVALKGAVKWAAGGSAVTGAVGGIVGCGLGVHSKRAYQNILEGCRDGAIGGAILGAGTGALSGVITGATVDGWDHWVYDIPKDEKYEFKKKLARVLKMFGGLGILFGGIHTVKELATMNGVELVCGEDGLSYELYGLNYGAKTPLLSYGRNGLQRSNDYKYPISTDNSSAIESYLRDQGVPEEAIKPTAQAILIQNANYVEKCKSNQGKTFKYMDSDLEKLDEERKVTTPSKKVS